MQAGRCTCTHLLKSDLLFSLSDQRVVCLENWHAAAAHPPVLAFDRGCGCIQGRETAAEKRYRKLLLSGLELNKDFYFSYTYNLARTLQANLTADAPSDPFDSMFVWNEYLSRYMSNADPATNT